MKIPFFKTSKLISIHRAGVLAARVTIYNFKSWPTCAWGWDEEEEMETWTNEREIFRDLSNSCVNILISFFFFFKVWYDSTISSWCGMKNYFLSFRLTE